MVCSFSARLTVRLLSLAEHVLGNATSEEIRSFLQNYGSIMDYPAAVNGPELYAAYPEAKYILVKSYYFAMLLTEAH